MRTKRTVESLQTDQEAVTEENMVSNFKMFFYHSPKQPDDSSLSPIASVHDAPVSYIIHFSAFTYMTV